MRVRIGPHKQASQLTQLLRGASLAWLIALAAMSIAMPAHAKRIYQYRDAKGILHFTDRKPAEGTPEVKETLVKVDREPLVDMRTSDTGKVRRFSFFNRLSGPVELELSFERVDNITSAPPLPLRVVLPPQVETPVATVGPADTRLAASYSIAYSAVPGDPGAAPRPSVVYDLPLPEGSDFELHQGFGGPATHTDPQSLYAVDLAVPEGTPVLAARDGIVMQVEEDFAGAGMDRERFLGRANNVRVVHEDGTMALYAHLKLESVVVSAGQRVTAGRQLGESGNTGFSSGPHLHFSVQVNRGMELVSIPFRIRGLTIPEE